MSLKSSIEQIFQDNTNYTYPSQAVNQASSLNVLSGDLYTDSRRFIYELLQNADDSPLDDTSVEVWIKTIGDYLVVAHSGKPFSPRDLQGICSINNGTKKSDLKKTGYKGIGFKSVFGQSDEVIIYTEGEYFRFDSSYQFGWTWEISKVDWEQQNDRKFQFPWQIIPVYTKAEEVDEPIKHFLQNINANVATVIKLKNTKETTQAVQNLSKDLNMFLFLKNISEINFDISDSISVKINRLTNNRITLRKGNDSDVEWLLNTVNLTIPTEIRTSIQDERNIPEKLLNTETIELSLAAKVGREGIVKLTLQERLLYSYLPTDETRYSLPVLVNTSFLTTANRESLHADSRWNQWLFKSIAIEIFKWISKLVSSEFEYQAYRLIPDKTAYDELGNEFNKGITEAIDTIPLVATNNGNELAKIKDTIVDFTFLSEKDFVGEIAVKNFIDGEEKNSTKKFAANTGFGSDFKRLGATCFEWKDIHSFLSSESFINTHTLGNNIQLIKYFKNLCDSGSVKDLSTDKLLKLPFIWDHKNNIKLPTQVCFPAANDQNWNNPESELSFLHLELQNWLHSEPEMRVWLESLGVTEKTDVTFITQTILPQIDTYITSENAIQTIRELFNLYRKGDLKESLITELSRIKLLTQENSLCPAKDCFLSDFYSPRLEIEDILGLDIFVNRAYCLNIHDKDEWKRFFKMMGVNEGISTISYEKTSKASLNQNNNFKSEYFEEEDKYFQPWQTRFNADEYSNLTTLVFLTYTSDFIFSKSFWSDVITNIELNLFDFPATAYWGKDGYAGRNSGNEVANYLKWFVKNNECIPTVMESCQKTNEVFINTEDIVKIAGNYLPVFSGGDLSQDWRSFFHFKTTLQLADYLEILTGITLDLNENEKIKRENFQRVQSIYRELLDQCTNWSSENITQVENWAKTGFLVNTNQQFSECNTLKYFLDGNQSIFQEQFNFLALDQENKRHPNLENFLIYFKITVLRQSDFELDYTQKELCSGLINQLRGIVPYFRIWIENELGDDKTRERLTNLQIKVEELEIYQAADLTIKYENIGFTKSVNVHFNDKSLFVTAPWNANSVLLKLPEVLCRYFYLLGHDKKLDFLLRSSSDEIQKYFEQEKIEIPEDLNGLTNQVDTEVESQVPETEKHLLNINSFADIESAINEGKISLAFFHLSRPDYEKLRYVEQLISRAVTNIIKYLDVHPEYDCTNSFEIGPSIVGGITKNGNEITIVARPSDNDEVLLYYTSEFDVLEYVDAEFWCEDGIDPPKQITLGHLLKKTGINRIPIRNINISGSDLDTILNDPKSEVLDFNAVPFVPQKIAKIISSFANTNGGTLIFGLKEISPTSNEIVGLSSDFKVVEITKNAISLLSPIPSVTYDWMTSGDKSLFVIKTNKADNDILLDNQRYIRNNTITEAVIDISNIKKTLAVSQFRRTVAIVIGIENYLPKNQILSVKYANADVLKFKKMLIEKMNVLEGDIHTFLNEEALKSSLEYDLKGLFHYLTEEDRLIFYYVGHGFHNGITNFLSTYDTHKHHISETSVSLSKILLDPLRKSKCKNAFIFIDACAKSFQEENERSQITDINDEELVLLTNEFPYYATFLSCQPGQSSYSSDILKNGIWTYHLIKAISGEVSEVIYDSKYITDVLVKDYLSNSVATYVKNELGYDQHPRAILDSSHENIIVELEEEIIK